MHLSPFSSHCDHGGHVVTDLEIQLEKSNKNSLLSVMILPTVTTH